MKGHEIQLSFLENEYHFIIHLKSKKITQLTCIAGTVEVLCNIFITIVPKQLLTNMNVQMKYEIQFQTTS